MKESEFDRLEFYREAYYKEIDIKSNLNNEIAFQGTTLTALLSGIFYLATSFQSPCNGIHTAFLVFCLAPLLSIVYGAYYLLKSYYNFSKGGRSYTYLPPMELIEVFYYNKAARNDSRLKIHLINVTTKARDNNAEHNRHKSELLTKASKGVALSFIFGIIIVFLYLIHAVFVPYFPDTKKESIPASTIIINNNERSPRTERASGTRANTTTATSGTPLSGGR